MYNIGNEFVFPVWVTLEKLEEFFNDHFYAQYVSELMCWPRALYTLKGKTFRLIDEETRKIAGTSYKVFSITPSTGYVFPEILLEYLYGGKELTPINIF